MLDVRESKQSYRTVIHGEPRFIVSTACGTAGKDKQGKNKCAAVSVGQTLQTAFISVSAWQQKLLILCFLKREIMFWFWKKSSFQFKLEQ